jgi:hypothetical protein
MTLGGGDPIRHQLTLWRKCFLHNADSRSAGQEIPRLLWKAHYSVHKSPPLDPDMKEPTPVHTCSCLLCFIHTTGSARFIPLNITALITLYFVKRIANFFGNTKTLPSRMFLRGRKGFPNLLYHDTFLTNHQSLF